MKNEPQMWKCPECGTQYYSKRPREDVLKFPVMECEKGCKGMFYDPEDARRFDKRWEANQSKKAKDPLPGPTKA